MIKTITNSESSGFAAKSDSTIAIAQTSAINFAIVMRDPRLLVIWDIPHVALGISTEVRPTGQTSDRYYTLIREFPLRPLGSDKDLDQAIAMLDSSSRPFVSSGAPFLNE